MLVKKKRADPKQLHHHVTYYVQGNATTAALARGSDETAQSPPGGVSTLTLGEAQAKNKRRILAAAGTAGFSPPRSLGGFEFN